MACMHRETRRGWIMMLPTWAAGLLGLYVFLPTWPGHGKGRLGLLYRLELSFIFLFSPEQLLGELNSWESPSCRCLTVPLLLCFIHSLLPHSSSFLLVFPFCFLPDKYSYQGTSRRMYPDKYAEVNLVFIPTNSDSKISLQRRKSTTNEAPNVDYREDRGGKGMEILRTVRNLGITGWFV